MKIDYPIQNSNKFILSYSTIKGSKLHVFSMPDISKNKLINVGHPVSLSYLTISFFIYNENETNLPKVMKVEFNFSNFLFCQD